MRSGRMRWVPRHPKSSPEAGRTSKSPTRNGRACFQEIFRRSSVTFPDSRGSRAVRPGRGKERKQIGDACRAPIGAGEEHRGHPLAGAFDDRPPRRTPSRAPFHGCLRTGLRLAPLRKRLQFDDPRFRRLHRGVPARPGREEPAPARRHGRAPGPGRAALRRGRGNGRRAEVPQRHPGIRIDVHQQLQHRTHGPRLRLERDRLSRGLQPRHRLSLRSQRYAPRRGLSHGPGEPSRSRQWHDLRG